VLGNETTETLNFDVTRIRWVYQPTGTAAAVGAAVVGSNSDIYIDKFDRIYALHPDGSTAWPAGADILADISRPLVLGWDEGVIYFTEGRNLRARLAATGADPLQNNNCDDRFSDSIIGSIALSTLVDIGAGQMRRYLYVKDDNKHLTRGLLTLDATASPPTLLDSCSVSGVFDFQSTMLNWSSTVDGATEIYAAGQDIGGGNPYNVWHLAINAANNDIVEGRWKTPFKPTMNDPTTDPVPALGHVLLVSADNNDPRGVLSVRKSDGATDGFISHSRECLTSPIVGSVSAGSARRVYVGCQDRVVGGVLDPSTGLTSNSGWTATVLQGNLVVTGAVGKATADSAAGVVYQPTSQGLLYALDGATGEVRWVVKVSASALSSSPALVADGTLYVGSNDGKMYAVITDSLGLMDSPWPKDRHDNQNTGNAGLPVR